MILFNLKESCHVIISIFIAVKAFSIFEVVMSYYNTSYLHNRLTASPMLLILRVTIEGIKCVHLPLTKNKFREGCIVSAQV